MSTSTFKEVIRTIGGNKSLRRIAAASIKREVDYIYGYSKYSLNEIDLGLESRLHSMTYLARSIVGIIGKKGVALETKTQLCRHYLQLLEPYVERHLPKPVYEWDFEPKYTLEMAVFLDAVGEIDWRKYGLLEQIVIFGKDSSVESKAKFLELFIDHLNHDQQMLKHFSSEPRKELEELEAPGFTLFDVFFIDSYPEEIPSSTFNILKHLAQITSSQHIGGKNVPLKALGNLNCLTLGDINWVMDHIILFGVPNRVKACEDLYEALLGRGEDLKTLQSLASQVKGAPDSYILEPKVKGFLKVAARLPVDKAQLVKMAAELLDPRISSNARLWIYKLIHKESGSGEILERAKDDNSKIIREWAAKASKLAPAR